MSDAEPSPAPEARYGFSSIRPPRLATAGYLVGQVEACMIQTESRGRFDTEVTMTFRLLGQRGQRPRVVHLRGSSISGTVSDGDWVEVLERDRSGPLEVGTLLNLTTDREVRVSGRAATTGMRLVRLLLLLVLVLILLLIVRASLEMFGVVHQGWPFGGGGQLGGGFDGGLDPGSTSPRLVGVA